MDLLAFGQALETLRITEIRAVAGHLVAARESTADEIDVTRALLHVERVVRGTRRKNQAAMAAITVIALVQEAARRDGVPLPDDDVTRVARAAAVVARAIVAGDVAEREARMLASGFERVVLLHH